MSSTRSAAPDRRPAKAGLRRIEVMGRPDDRELLRRVALALAAGDALFRARLLELTDVGPPPPSEAAEGAAVVRPGLGTRIAALFADCPFEGDLPELGGEVLRPPDFNH